MDTKTIIVTLVCAVLGSSALTARAWVKPNNATDIYKVGEWCVFGGKYYVSKRGTDFSPTEYPADWEEQE